jgi:hypothetical protein
MTTETAIQILQSQIDWYKDQRNRMPSISERCKAFEYSISELAEAARNKKILQLIIAQYEEEKRLRDKSQGKQAGYKYAHRAAAFRDFLKKINQQTQ